MLLDTARQGHLLTNLRARRGRQLNLREIGLDTEYASSSRCRTDVDQQQLVLHELRHLCLFLVLRLHTKQAAQKEQADLELGVHFWQLAHRAKHLSDETIGPAQRGVNARADTDKPSWNREREQVVLRMQRHDTTEYRFALVPPSVVLRDDTWADLDLEADAQDAGEDRPAGNNRP